MSDGYDPAVDMERCYEEWWALERERNLAGRNLMKPLCIYHGGCDEVAAALRKVAF